jgi:hypothetical protein
MTINEFTKKATARGYMPISADEQIAKLKKELDVKNYLGIRAKKGLVQEIVNETIIYENGLFKFNAIDQFIVLNMFAIRAYTNLQIENIEDDYDLLCESGLMNKVLATFESEYKEILSLLQMQCDYVLMDNSVTAQFNVLFEAAANAINKFSDSAGDMFKNIKPEDVMTILNKFK